MREVYRRERGQPQREAEDANWPAVTENPPASLQLRSCRRGPEWPADIEAEEASYQRTRTEDMAH